MNNNRVLLLVLITILIAVFTGSFACTQEGIKPLTDDEKAALVEIALTHPEVSKWLETADVYSTEVGWSAVGWNNSEATGWARLEYEEIANGNLPSDRAFPSEHTSINPDVHIRVGEPAGKHIHVAFDREKQEVVAVQLMPGRPTAGPTPATETHPKGMENLRWLTNDEKDKVIEIALNTPEAIETSKKYPVSKTSIGWVAIEWQNGVGMHGFDYEMVSEVPDNVPETAEFYSRVEIYFGEPERVLMRVAINPDTCKVARIMTHPLKRLP